MGNLKKFQKVPKVIERFFLLFFMWANLVLLIQVPLAPTGGGKKKLKTKILDTKRKQGREIGELKARVLCEA